MLKRSIIGILMAIAMFFVVSLTINMSIAIVPMISKYKIELENGTLMEVADFSWDSVEKGHILSSFFCGNALSYFVGGILTAHFGGTLIMGAGLIIGSICSLLTPFAAYFGMYPIIALRTLSGCFVGVAFPCMNVLFSKWTPPDERSRMVTFAIMGADIGNAFCFTAYGIMAHYLGWKTLFYFPGMLCVLFCLIWFVMVKDDPADDPKISPSELLYLQKHLVVAAPKKIQTPWKDILTSKPVWAVTFGFFANSWGFYMVYTELPMFLKDVFQYDSKQIGYAQFFPYIALSVSTVLSGMFSDYLVQRVGYSINLTRKLFATTSFIFAGVSVVVIAFSNSILVIIMMLNLMLTCQGFFNASLMVNSLDLAPQYAGVISGLVCAVGFSPSFIVPTVVGFIVPNQSRAEWRFAFLLSCILHILGAVCFLIFGSGKLQSWAKDKEEIELATNEYPLLKIATTNKNGKNSNGINNIDNSKRGTTWPSLM